MLIFSLGTEQTGLEIIIRALQGEHILSTRKDCHHTKFFHEIYSNGEKVLLRHDYKELLEVSLKLLGSELPAEKEFTWKKVRAVNKARFMAWSLCSVKAFAFSSLVDFSEETKENLQCFTLFQVTIYIPHFLMSSI